MSAITSGRSARYQPHNAPRRHTVCLPPARGGWRFPLSTSPRYSSRVAPNSLPDTASPTLHIPACNPSLMPGAASSTFTQWATSSMPGGNHVLQRHPRARTTAGGKVIGGDPVVRGVALGRRRPVPAFPSPGADNPSRSRSSGPRRETWRWCRPRRLLVRKNRQP